VSENAVNSSTLIGHIRVSFIIVISLFVSKLFELTILFHAGLLNVGV